MRSNGTVMGGMNKEFDEKSVSIKVQLEEHNPKTKSK